MTKEILLSDKSDKLKHFRALQENSKKREETNTCLVFGKKTVLELDHVVAYLTTESSKDDKALIDHDRYVLSDSAFKKLSGLVNPEPYGAIVNLNTKAFPQKILSGVIVLDDINDPGNLGTILRTAWGMGLDGIILTKNSVDPYHPKVIRASKGVSLKMPILTLDKSQIHENLQTLGVDVFCADLNGKDLSDVKSLKPFALILGNESQGLSLELSTLGQKIHIKQQHLESYNVAIAAALISYHLLHARKK